MGYACPVCEMPQADAGHLANHLAFTALLGDDDHEAWLDDHVPGWAEEGEQALADRVAPEADPADYPQVFEDTTGHRHWEDHDHEYGLPAEQDRGTPVGGADGVPDGAAREILERARSMTDEMLGDAGLDAEDAATEAGAMDVEAAEAGTDGDGADGGDGT